MDFFSNEAVLTCRSQPHEFSTTDREIKYYVKGPDKGPSPNTGVMLVIHGQAEHPNMHYYKNIRHEWANLYNVVTISIEYLGTKNLSNPPAPYSPDPKVLFDALSWHYTIEELRAAIVNNQIDFSRFAPKTIPELVLSAPLPDEPFDFGFIQAVDCLAALKNFFDLASSMKIPLNPRRSFLYGVSMGGFIAQMCNKLAPSTFSVLGDIAGFVNISRERITNGLCMVNFGKVRFNVNYGNYYSADENSPAFYDEGMFEIRNLLNADHLALMNRIGADQNIVMLHGIDDHVVPVTQKSLLFHNMLQAGHHCEFFLFYNEHVDGCLITETGHTIGDRPRLFEKYVGHYIDESSPHSKFTSYPNDFVQKNTLVYPVSNGKYVMDYGGDFPVICFVSN